MAFDLEGARRAGYSDEEIARHLAKNANFDVEGAFRAGYGAGDVIDHLMSRTSEKEKTAGTGQTDAKNSEPQAEKTPERAEGWQRNLGLAGRAAIDGVTELGDMIAAPVRYGLNKGVALAGGPEGYFQPVTGRLPDYLGLPTPETKGEKLASSAISGATSVLPTLGIGALPGLAARAPAIARALSELPVAQMVGGAGSGAGSELARQNGAGTGGQIAASLVGGVVPTGLAAAGRAARNSLAGLVNQDKLAAFRAAGVEPPSLGAVSDSGTVQMIESGLSQALPSAGVMKRAAERGREAFNTALDNAAGRLAGGRAAPNSAEEMGALARGAAEDGRNAFRLETARREAAAYPEHVAQSPARIDNINALVDENATRFGNGHYAQEYRDQIGRELGGIAEDAQPVYTINGQVVTAAEMEANPILRQYAQESQGPLNVAALRDWRAEVGSRLEAPPTANTTDASKARRNALYGAATRDIEAAVPEEALEGIRNYNRWYSGEKELRRGVDRVFFGPRDDSATGRAILSADAEQLANLRHVVGDDAFGQLQAGALRELTRGKDGASAQVAATKLAAALPQPPNAAANAAGANAANAVDQYGKTGLQPQVLQALLGGEAEGIARLGRALSESRAMSNTSNTAGALNAINTIGGGGWLGAMATGNPIPAIGMLAAPYLAARGMTSQGMINRLASMRQRPGGGLVPLNAGAQAVMRAYLGGD